MEETKKDILRRLFVQNNLVKEDVFKHQHFTIITRAGIDKIQAANKIQIKYDKITYISLKLDTKFKISMKIKKYFYA